MTLINPCLDTAVASIVFDPTSITLPYGSTSDAEFVIPSAGVYDTLCGTKNYAITNTAGTDVSSWASIIDSATSGSKTLRIDASGYTAITS